MNFIEKITPSFLKIINQKLLVNKPLIWRTKIHYLIFGVLLANAVLLALAFGMPIEKHTVPFNLTLYSWFSLYFVLMGFAGLYWAYTQFQHKLKTVGTLPQLKTTSLYLFGAFLLISPILTSSSVVFYRIANTVDQTTLIDEEDFLEKNNFIGYESNLPRPNLNEEGLAIIKSYGFSQMDYEAMRHDYYTAVEDRINAIMTAQKIIGNTGRSYFDDYFNFGVLFVFLVPCILLLVSFARIKEIALVTFLHFMTFGLGVFISEFNRMQPDEFYLPLLFAVGLSLLFSGKNNFFTRTRLFYLMALIPITAFAFWTDTYEIKNESLSVLFILTAMLALTTSTAVIMSKQLNKPLSS